MDRTCENQYDGIAPIDFFEKMVGRKAVLTEILIIEYILDTFTFETTVQNLLIEQIFIMNEQKLARGFAIKLATEWEKCQFKSLREAQRYVAKERDLFRKFQVRDYFGETRELTSGEKQIVNRLYCHTSLQPDLLDCAICYCMKVNDGYIIGWFIHRLVDFLTENHVTTVAEANETIATFHQRFVIGFGRG